MADNTVTESPSKELMSFAGYLYNPSKSGLRAREGVLNGRRVQFFKGKSAVNALTKAEDGKNPKVSSQEEAIDWVQELLDFQLIVRCDRVGDGSRQLRVNPMQNYEEEAYYAWLYEGSQMFVILGGIGVVAVVLAGVMFPLWPSVLRNGTWYLSMLALGLIGLLFATAIVRLIVYIISLVAAPQGLWIFPNLFEDVGFFESFVPLYGWEVPKDAVLSGKAGGPGPSGNAADSGPGVDQKKID
ncbi:translocation protein Sec62-domain-containing protein [Kickxella alabastrina]|uniref:translocation protein Sec62-domain-containing protein n=1 Tax=Kickxella alabastrina TaxID=61397 RepID=UPI0022203D9D|nr:translocation protein Sec62-domain-containing protein [Kickxella alabastrina]KAI7825792.1 translocation protein Sec62-domain-containing protein [Kickxella alabastrina]